MSATLDSDRDAFHHKGAITLYAISSTLIAILLVLHAIASFKQSKRRINKTKQYKKKTKAFYHHYLSISLSGLSMLCYFTTCFVALLGELHIPYCFCDIMPNIMTSVYAVGKILNYSFFLVRAESAQGLLNIFPATIFGLCKFPSKDAMFHIVFPIGLFITICIYLFIFNIGEPIFQNWTGVCVHTPVDLGCNYLLNDDMRLMGYLSILVDASLCAMFTYLFYVPITRVTNMKLKDVIGKDDENEDRPQTKEKFIYVLKVSLVLALINISSSTLCFSILPNFADIWWLWGFDYGLNAFCVFLMMGNDRRLLANILCCCCWNKKSRTGDQEKENSKSDKSENGSSKTKNNPSTTAGSHPSLKSMDTLHVIEQIEMEQKGDNLLNVVSASEDDDSANITDVDNESDRETQEQNI